MDKDELSMYGVSAEEKPPEEKPQKQIKKNRPPAPRPPEVGPEVWISCRAKEGCSGKNARLILKQKNPGGGAILRYRCLTCNRTFSIST